MYFTWKLCIARRVFFSSFEGVAQHTHDNLLSLPWQWHALYKAMSVSLEGVKLFIACFFFFFFSRVYRLLFHLCFLVTYGMIFFFFHCEFLFFQKVCLIISCVVAPLEPVCSVCLHWFKFVICFSELSLAFFLMRVGIMVACGFLTAPFAYINYALRRMHFFLLICI